jgi:hypothetical protein
MKQLFVACWFASVSYARYALPVRLHSVFAFRSPSAFARCTPSIDDSSLHCCTRSLALKSVAELEHMMHDGGSPT